MIQPQNNSGHNRQPDHDRLYLKVLNLLVCEGPGRYVLAVVAVLVLAYVAVTIFA